MSFNITSDQGMLTFTITRPEVRNAVNHEVMEGLERFINMIEQDCSVKWGIITSEGGKAFCSGGDLGEFHALETSAQALPMLSRMTELLYRLATLPVPTLALMDGAAVGGGCEIAAACDYRLMKSGAKAGFIQGSLAITTGWGGASLLYEKESGHSKILQLLTEARVHTAEDLAEWGWITNTYTSDKQVALERFTAKFDLIEPSVLQAYKTIAIRKWEQSDLKSRMIDECKRCSILWESEAHHAAVHQFRNR
ncbi:enoyl-CoA hydratase/isomerase family protein [Sporosarcina sp. BI001-red]|uniref:enoyl-CoA hydratase/isomerase family protein n=1 Tax=Sporosarcina sp. BI001-red TaxID=2282866 RepID=UPI000E24361C|nr:enoyl-CoA hydratase/isomerase family protein [Sporosarcina sp. BI001-red]REB09662.1 enoyl-CoA hydratase/isomerase family protein [Sporosarcina sp. BI001-red]